MTRLLPLLCCLGFMTSTLTAQDSSSVTLSLKIASRGKGVSVPVRLAPVGREGVLTMASDEQGSVAFEVPAGSLWRIHAGVGVGRRVLSWRAVSDGAAAPLTIALPAAEPETADAGDKAARKWFERRFASREAPPKALPEPSSLLRLLRTREGDRRVRLQAWEAYANSPLVAEARREFEARRVRSGKHESAWVAKTVGERSANGWALVIALHGGGGAPKRVNDSQWRIMQRYYKDHPEAGGYRYVALRAPNDRWNGFYDDYVYPLIERLINHHLLFGDVDPDRVHVIGYSHGGYGVFSIAPKIPDRFAAAHASAAAPTDGQTLPFGLRNLPFSFMCGEKDTAHGRIERCRRFAALLDGLAKEHPDGWPCRFLYQPGYGHGGLPDRDILPRLLAHRREPLPDTLHWQLSDPQVRRHYWLATEDPGFKRWVRAELKANRLHFEADGLKELRALLDARLVDPRKPFTLSIAGKARRVTLKPSLEILARTLLERGDPRLASTIELPLIRH